MPPLAEIWAALRGRFDAPPFLVIGATVCEAMDRLSPDGRQVSLDQWHQWQSRARREAHERVADADLWARLFQYLLPDRQSSDPAASTEALP